MPYFITRGYPGGGVSRVGQPILAVLPRSVPRITGHESPATEHGSRSTSHRTRATPPLVPRYRCAATRKVPESRQLLIFYGATPPGNISAPDGV
jgi:hypothetical protein